MSDQEQHEIIGRMVAEYGELRKRIAALNGKANDTATVLRRVAGNLLPEPDSRSSRMLIGMSLQDAIDKYPSREDLTALDEEIEAAKRRKAELLKSLREIGYEPKD